MLFPTFAFFVFFIVVWAAFWLVRDGRFRLVWLAVASAAFYSFWNPWFLILIGCSTSVDYVVARRLPPSARVVEVGCVTRR